MSTSIVATALHVFMCAIVVFGSTVSTDEHVVLGLTHFNDMVADTAALRAQVAKSNEMKSAVAISLNGLPRSMTHVVRNSTMAVKVACDQRSAVATHTLELDVMPSGDGLGRWTSIEIAATDQLVEFKRVVAAPGALLADMWHTGANGFTLFVLAANASTITPIVVEFATRHHIVNSGKTHTLAVSRLQPFDAMTLAFAPNCPASVAFEFLQIAQRAFVPEVNDATTSTAVAIQLASTTIANVEWRCKGESSDTTAGTTASALITASLESLYSVADDGVQGFTALTLALNADAQNLQHLTIDLLGDNIRITEVSGLWLDTWSAVAATPGRTTVNAHLRRPIGSAQYTLVLRTEMVTTDEFELPVINPHDCVRTSGRTAVTTAKNHVEITEVSAVGVAHIGEHDFSSHITEQSRRPVLLAYSFVTADGRVRLRRRVHNVLDIVPAFSDHVHETIHVARDYCMHIVRGLVQNSRRQFLQIVMPRTVVNVLSVSVNSDAVAPSLADGSDHIMSIPLLSTLRSTDASGSSQQASFEVVFVTRNNVTLTADEGELEFALSQIDMPTTLQTATVRVPFSLVPAWQSDTMTMVHRQPRVPEQIRSKPLFGRAKAAPERMQLNVDDELANGHYAQRIVEDYVTMRAAAASPIGLPPTDHMIETFFERNLVQPDDANRIRMRYVTRERIASLAYTITQRYWTIVSVAFSLSLIVLSCVAFRSRWRRHRPAAQTVVKQVVMTDANENQVDQDQENVRDLSN